MTAPAPLPETILSFCCRQKLAKELGVEPSELAYIGITEAPSYRLFCFNVMREGPGYGSTRTVKVNL